jgi:hypothetical protein
MKHSARWAATALVAFAAVGGWFTFRAEPSVKPAKVASSSEKEAPRSRAERAEVERLRAELNGVKAGLNALTRAASQEVVVASKSAEATPAEELEEEEVDPMEAERTRREEAARIWDEHMAEVSANFQAEAVDNSWAAPTAKTVAQALQDDPALSAAAGAIDCRSQTCRVELKNDGTGTLDKQLPLFAQTLGPVLPRIDAAHERDPGGTERVVLYLTNRTSAMQ